MKKQISESYLQGKTRLKITIIVHPSFCLLSRHLVPITMALKCSFKLIWLISVSIVCQKDTLIISLHAEANKLLDSGELLKSSSCQDEERLGWRKLSRIHFWRWAQKNGRFWTVLLGKTLESPLDSTEVKPVNPKGNHSFIFIGRTNADADFFFFLTTTTKNDAKNCLIGKDPDTAKDRR